MFPKGTVAAAVTPAEKPPATAQKESTVVYMVDNADSQIGAVNDPYWRIQRARICACSVVLVTLILVAGTLGGITIVLTHVKGMATTQHPSLNHDREPLLSNEVPLPKLPESTIRIKIDDGGLLPPKEPTTPDLKATEDVTDGITEPLPTVPSSSGGSDDSHPSSDRSRGGEGIPPRGQSNWIGSDFEASGDYPENDSGSGGPDLFAYSLSYPLSSSDAYDWRSIPSDGIVADSGYILYSSFSSLIRR